MIECGQLEIVGGGAVPSDEALTNTEMLVRNLEEGHKFLYDTFGISKVRIAWQTASMGHSSRAVQLLAEAGFEGLVLDKVNEDFRAKLGKEASLEFLWSGVLTHVLQDSYRFPAALNPGSPENCWATSFAAW